MHCSPGTQRLCDNTSFRLRRSQAAIARAFAAAATTLLLTPWAHAEPSTPSAPVVIASPSARVTPSKARAAKRSALRDAPPPNQSSTGAAGTTGDPGNPGGDGNNLTLAASGTIVQPAGTTPSIGLVSTGGVGGTGNAGSDSSSSGGRGGNGGSVAAALTGVASSITTSGTAPAIQLQSTGGAGGVAGALGQSLGNPGAAGAGGDAGTVTLSTEGGTIVSTTGWSGSTPGTTAVALSSTGGTGGVPAGEAEAIGSVDGARGANGGNGQAVTVIAPGGSIVASGTALSAISRGGDGAAGVAGTGGFGKGAGGNGGSGGAGGNVTLDIGAMTLRAQGAATAATGQTVPVDDQGNAVQASYLAAGVMAQSLGGFGGAGGSGDGMEGVSGKGGVAGNAGSVAFSSGSDRLRCRGRRRAIGRGVRRQRPCRRWRVRPARG